MAFNFDQRKIAHYRAIACPYKDKVYVRLRTRADGSIIYSFLLQTSSKVPPQKIK